MILVNASFEGQVLLKTGANISMGYEIRLKKTGNAESGGKDRLK